MNIEFQSLLPYSLNEMAELLNHAFEGYIVPIRFEPPMLAGMIRAESVDLNASRIALVDGKPAGIGLIERRGFDCRLAAMSIRTERLSKGVGKQLVKRLGQKAAS